jgi:hypothetical protein
VAADEPADYAERGERDGQDDPEGVLGEQGDYY